MTFFLQYKLVLNGKWQMKAFKCDTGTAGVWRIAALNEAGGWKDRTTVEDMDLAVRASLKGWKFVYLGDVKVLQFLVNYMYYLFLDSAKAKAILL